MNSNRFQERIKLRVVDIARSVISLFGGCTSRTAEYNFILSQLPPPGSTVLDVGCSGSLLALRLAQRGYEVYGIDTRPYPERHSHLKFVQGDILYSPFPDEFFDAVVAVSTLEHIGLASYGDPAHEDGDELAVREISRLLKSSGKLIVTVPFAAEYRTAPWAGGIERYYDSASLQTIFQSFEIQTRQFYVGKLRFRWVSASEQEAKNPCLKWHANVALCLIKKS